MLPRGEKTLARVGALIKEFRGRRAPRFADRGEALLRPFFLGPFPVGKSLGWEFYAS